MPHIRNVSSSEIVDVVPTAKNGYRGMLVDLSRMMKKTDLKEFKFVLKDRIPDGIREKLREPLDVFTVLEEYGLLGPSKLDELRRLLGEIDRPKMIELVNEFDDADSKFPLKPSSDNRLQKDGYIISVEGGRHFETSQGEFVEVRSGSNYSLTLTNNNHHRCLLKIKIDDYQMFPTGFIFSPKMTYTIERPARLEEKFKFYAIRDAPDGSGINKWRKDANGVIQVKFTPEKADMNITCIATGEKAQTISCSTEVTDVDFLKMVSRVFDKAVVTVMINTKPLGKRGVKLTEYGIRDGSRVNVNVGGVGGKTLPAFVRIATTQKKVEWRAGATTLEGKSEQKFGSGKSFPIDESQAVTLNLRLVARENERPLPSTGNPTPLTRATLIPPPCP